MIVFTVMHGDAAPSFDWTLLHAIHESAPESWQLGMEAVSTLGSLGVLAALATAVVLGLGWRRRWADARLVVMTGLTTLLLVMGLKLLFHRPRPQLWAPLADATYSFPSGHALGSVVIYGLVAYLAATANPPLRLALWSLYGVIVLSVGFSRLYLGYHWPTDVLAGWAAGIAVLAGSIYHRRRQAPRLGSAKTPAAAT